MDEKNAYIELIKQNRAKHRAELKASKEIKELEQKKEKVILKYEQAAKDNTCITFHQYCRKKWASEAGIESVPDDDETDVEWQEKLNAKQKEEDAWEDVPDVGNGLKRVNERLVARLRVILGTELVDHDLKLGAKTNITAQNAAFFDLLLLFKKKEGVQLFKNFMARALDEAAREDGWWLDSLDDSVMKARDEVLKEIIIRGIQSLEMNRRLGLEKEKLELIIKLHFPKEVEDNKSCMIKTFEELSDMVQDYEYNCPHDIDANLVIYEKMSEILNECMGKLKEISKHMEFYEEEDVYEELERLFGDQEME